MKSLLLLLVLVAYTVAINAQKVTIKAGTIIPVQSEKSVKAADVHEGEVINFTVTSDVKVDDIKVIEKGALVKGTVREAQKSSLAGTKGKLVIDLTNMTLPNGDPLFFTNSTVRIYGKNRTPLAVVTGLFVLPCIFIPGTKAEMPAGYETKAVVANNTEVAVK